MSHTENTAFHGVRVTIQSDHPFDVVLGALLDDIGHTPVPPNDVAAANETWASYEAAMTTHLGESGFMLFATIDHGAWISKQGIGKKSVRVVLGNPMIAITLIKHDLTAGLFAPVELIITEGANGNGQIDYLRPSSLLLHASESLMSAAVVLDEKFSHLVRKAAGLRN
jgi:uncharacterized protein (DUF302 family)